MDQDVADQNNIADRLVVALRRDKFVLFRHAIVPLLPLA